MEKETENRENRNTRKQAKSLRGTLEEAAMDGIDDAATWVYTQMLELERDGAHQHQEELSLLQSGMTMLDRLHHYLTTGEVQLDTDNSNGEEKKK